jgi:hypothetical protein
MTWLIRLQWNHRTTNIWYPKNEHDSSARRSQGGGRLQPVKDYQEETKG